MARYNTPVRDWDVRMPSDLRQASRKQPAIKTNQQGVCYFGSKKKHGCKLASARSIRDSINKGAKKLPHVQCRLAFPKINIQNPEQTPKLVVRVKKLPAATSPIKPEKFALNTVRVS